MAGAIKSSNSLPCDRKEDWDYYTTFKSFRDVTRAQQVWILSNGLLFYFQRDLLKQVTWAKTKVKFIAKVPETCTSRGGAMTNRLNLTCCTTK